MKPVLYGFNKKSGGNNLDETDPETFKNIVSTLTADGSHYVVIDAVTEHELSEFDAEEKSLMRQDLGYEGEGIDALIRAGYDLLGLMTYFTTGKVETRAWTIKKGSTAPQAGAAIHTDFEKKFIRAETIGWDVLLEVGSHAKARELGKMRTEGKEYIVQDGDVIEFKIGA